MINNRIGAPFRPRAPYRPTTVEARPIPATRPTRDQREYDPGDVGPRWPPDRSSREHPDNLFVDPVQRSLRGLFDHDPLERDTLIDMFHTAESNPLAVYMHRGPSFDVQFRDPRDDYSPRYKNAVLQRLLQLVAGAKIVASYNALFDSFEFDLFYGNVWNLAARTMGMFEDEWHGHQEQIATMFTAATNNPVQFFEDRVRGRQYRDPEDRRYKQGSLLMLVQLVAFAALYASVESAFDLDDFVSLAWEVAEQILEFF